MICSFCGVYQKRSENKFESPPCPRQVMTNFTFDGLLNDGPDGYIFKLYCAGWQLRLLIKNDDTVIKSKKRLKN